MNDRRRAIMNIFVRSENALDIPLIQGYPSDTNLTPDTKRKFIFGTYIVGLSRNNYYSPNGVVLLYIDENKISYKSNSGYGINIPLSLIVGSTYNISYDSDNNKNPGLGVTFYKYDGTMISYMGIEPGRNHLSLDFTVPDFTYYTLITFFGRDYNTYTITNIQLLKTSTGEPVQINDNSNFLAQYPSGVWNDTGYANAIITYDFNGKFTVNTSKELTETGTARSKILATFNVIAGHKYLLRGNPTKPSGAATSTNYSNLQVDQNQGYTEGTYILTNTAKIGEFTTSGEARLLMFYYTNQTYENAEYLPQMIDLTATFGPGNEPTTVEEFNELYPNKYYPYNAG